jgi:hypothetical protein
MDRVLHPAPTLLSRPEVAQYVRHITETGEALFANSFLMPHKWRWARLVPESTAKAVGGDAACWFPMTAACTFLLRPRRRSLSLTLFPESAREGADLIYMGRWHTSVSPPMHSNPAQ